MTAAGLRCCQSSKTFYFSVCSNYSCIPFSILLSSQISLSSESCRHSTAFKMWKMSYFLTYWHFFHQAVILFTLTNGEKNRNIVSPFLCFSGVFFNIHCCQIAVLLFQTLGFEILLKDIRHKDWNMDFVKPYKLCIIQTLHVRLIWNSPWGASFCRWGRGAPSQSRCDASFHNFHNFPQFTAVPFLFWWFKHSRPVHNFISKVFNNTDFKSSSYFNNILS